MDITIKPEKRNAGVLLKTSVMRVWINLYIWIKTKLLKTMTNKQIFEALYTEHNKNIDSLNKFQTPDNPYFKRESADDYTYVFNIAGQKYLLEFKINFYLAKGTYRTYKIDRSLSNYENWKMTEVPELDMSIEERNRDFITSFVVPKTFPGTTEWVERKMTFLKEFGSDYIGSILRINWE